MNYRNISNFAEGEVSTAIGRGKASLHSCLETENIRTHTGEAVPRPGQLYIDAEELAADDINTVYDYSREHRQFGNITFHREYLIAAGVNLYAFIPGQDNVWWLNEDYPLASDDLWIAEYQDWAYIADGDSLLMKYDAIQYLPVGVYLTAPAAAPALARSTEALAAALTDLHQGVRRYKYRYARQVGSTYDYSNFSPETENEPDFNFRKMNASVLASADARVTHIEIYCTLQRDNHEQLDNASFYRLVRIVNADTT